MKKVHIQTFGCQMNEYDTDKMLEVLAAEQYRYTDEMEEADLIILNTCSVREKAEQKVYSSLGRMRRYKEKNPDLVIGVGGCVAQQEGKSILQRARNVDMVFGTDNFFQLPQLLKDVSEGKRVVQTERVAYKQKVRNFIPDFTFQESSQVGLKAHLSITKGCNNFCSFCIVPITRGLEVSREPQNILQEAKELVAKGTKEICLLGQNVNSYRANGVDFVDLLHHLDEIKGLERVRFTSPHPKDFHERLAMAFRDLDSLCEHMHLPLQSGSNAVLHRMKRRHTREHYFEKVEMFRSYVPNGTLSTDLIVGFPGETDQDFEDTLDALRRVRYTQAYSFKYSPRPATPAAEYSEQLEEPVKIERLRILLETQEQILSELQQSLLDSVQEVLVEGPHPKNPKDQTGRSRGNHSIVIANSQVPVGTLLPVRLTRARQYSFEAEIVV